MRLGVGECPPQVLGSYTLSMYVYLYLYLYMYVFVCCLLTYINIQDLNPKFASTPNLKPLKERDTKASPIRSRRKREALVESIELLLSHAPGIPEQFWKIGFTA